ADPEQSAACRRRRVAASRCAISSCVIRVGGSRLALRSAGNTEVTMNKSAIRAIAQGASVASLVVCFGTGGNAVIAQQASEPIWQQVAEAGVFERIVVTAD